MTTPKGRPATKEPPSILVGLTAAQLRHYTAEEVEELKLLPLSARTLTELSYARKVPFVKMGQKHYWRLDQLLAISMAGDIEPVAA